MTVGEAGALLRARKLSCLELTGQCLAQIEKHDSRLNCFVTVTADRARTTARERDAELARGVDRGPFHGIPIAHKDILCTKGVLTTSGSLLYSDAIPDEDAEVVRRFDEAGAVLIGKTGMHELAYGITSDNPHFGAVRNPWDPARIPGGSSGGSGAALAAGMCLLATGTDTGGSIRIPASFCGVAGLKPTYGRVSRHGVRPLGLSLDHIGPMGLCAADLELALTVMEGVDSRDDSSRQCPPERPAQSMRHIRIGVPENFFFDQVDSAVEASVRGAIQLLETAGARVSNIQVPNPQALNFTARAVLLGEAAAVFANRRLDRDRFGADVLALLEQGAQLSAARYINAQRVRRQLVQDWIDLFRTIDFLITPCTPTTAPLIGQKEISINGAMSDVRLATTRLMRGINLIGFPSISIPCGQDGQGLPIGMQMIAAPWRDRQLLALAGQIENELSHAGRSLRVAASI